MRKLYKPPDRCFFLSTSAGICNNQKVFVDKKTAKELMDGIARYGWVPDLPGQRYDGHAAEVEVPGVMVDHSPCSGCALGLERLFHSLYA